MEHSTANWRKRSVSDIYGFVVFRILRIELDFTLKNENYSKDANCNNWNYLMNRNKSNFTIKRVEKMIIVEYFMLVECVELFEDLRQWERIYIGLCGISSPDHTWRPVRASSMSVALLREGSPLQKTLLFVGQGCENWRKWGRFLVSENSISTFSFFIC